MQPNLRASGGEAPSQDGLVQAIARLRDTLQEENAVLESGKPADHQGYIQRKNQLLRELMIFQRDAIGRADADEMQVQLNAVRVLVDQNVVLLKSHVDALSDITGLLTEAAALEDSDGTYSRRT
jgi:hypothetical protein